QRHLGVHIRPPLRSTLFPYTTLFRSLKRSLNANIMRQLLTMMLSKVAEGEARIADRAATFHRNGTGDPAGAGAVGTSDAGSVARSEEHTSELQSRENLVCRLLLEKKK